MIKPKEIRKMATLKESENYKFRNFLKNHANEEKLDEQFLRLHIEIFKNYDCTNCRNCCKEYNCVFEDDGEINFASEQLKLSKEEFTKTYLDYNESSHNYQSKDNPCNFLNDKGECILKDHKPIGCSEYPYTNKPKRLFSLNSIIDTLYVCPVSYEIWERLKQIYKFKSK